MKNPLLDGYLESAKVRVSKYFGQSGISLEHAAFVMSEIEAAHEKSYGDGRTDAIIEDARKATATLRGCNGAVMRLSERK